MPNARRQLGAGDLVAVLLLRTKVVVGAALAVLFIALAIALGLPDTFRGRTLLVIDPSKLPEKYTDGVRWMPPVDERLETLFQAALKRSELRAICDRFGLYDPAREGWLGAKIGALIGEPPDRLARDLAAEVLPTPPGRPRERRVIEVSYFAGEPKLAADVTNAFAFRLVELEHEFALAHMDEAIAFLESSAAAARGAFEEKSRELLDFKQLHQATLPERLPDLRHELETYRADALAAERAESEAATRIEAYTRTIDAYVQQAAAIRSGEEAALLGPGVAVDRRLEVLRTQIGELTLALADLAIRNMDTHPDNRRVAALLAAARAEYKALVEAQVAEQEASGERVDPNAPKDPAALAEIPPGSPLFAPYYAAVNLRESEKRQVEILRRELARLQGEQARVELLIAKVPETGRRLAELVADYDTLRATHDERQEQLLRARTMREVARQRKTEQLRVVEPAEATPVPYGPPRVKIALLGAVLALAAGAGAAFLAESRDTSLRSPDEAADRLGVPVLAAVPKVGG